MKVTKDSASATLTDVKNKIGDVFSLVDDFGEVTITSYNKPAYKITKITSDEKEKLKEEVEPVELTAKKPEVTEAASTDETSAPQVAATEPATPTPEPPTPAENAATELAEPEVTETVEPEETEPAKPEVSDSVEPQATETAEPQTETVEPRVSDPKVENFAPPAEFATLLQDQPEVESKSTKENKEEAIGTESQSSIVEFIAKSEQPVEEKKQDSEPVSENEWKRDGQLESDWVQKVRNLI